ncbi:MAG: hypothetical protein HFE90_09580 [Firmicutes bacterium]|nr:hypothetical protein [Bacillota bacterium]
MKKKRLISVVLSTIMLFGATSSVYASQNDSVTMDNSILYEKIVAEKSFEKIKQELINDYDELYELNNFDYDYTCRDIDGEKYLAINVYTDMTLTRHPDKSPFIMGMRDALSKSVDMDEKVYLESSINEYVNEIENLYYNVPDRSTFTYAVACTDSFKSMALSRNTNKYDLYYRTDTDEKTLLVDSKNLSEVENKQEKYQEGYNAIEEMREDINSLDMISANSARAVSYDRIAARDWARNNAFATPEYPSSQVSGTDCANFVSKALNAGGIPQDRAGKWYQASTWGGWPGDHWFRTGYNGSTGVVIYMKNKNYFYKQSDKSKVNAGSIMYWNNTSHVALVTYGDTVTIKYTQHGATQSKDTVYRSENASFYMPNSSILA